MGLDNEEYWDKVERLCSLVDSELLPLLPEGDKPIGGDTEWYLTMAFALAHRHDVTFPDSVLPLAIELDAADGDVYLS